jgi:predicted TIM-barrel fold metal-dependent hydrolase
MLKNNPKNKIIWAHCGWSRRLNVKNLDVIVDKMLSANKNLYVDISWIVLEEVISNNLNKWIKLIKKHNKKFLIGSDIVGKWDKYPYEITKYYKLLDKLDENTRKNICKNNVELLYK